MDGGSIGFESFYRGIKHKIRQPYNSETGTRLEYSDVVAETIRVPRESCFIGRCCITQGFHLGPLNIVSGERSPESAQDQCTSSSLPLTHGFDQSFTTLWSIPIPLGAQHHIVPRVYSVKWHPYARPFLCDHTHSPVPVDSGLPIGLALRWPPVFR